MQNLVDSVKRLFEFNKETVQRNNISFFIWHHIENFSVQNRYVVDVGLVFDTQTVNKAFFLISDRILDFKTLKPVYDFLPLLEFLFLELAILA